MDLNTIAMEGWSAWDFDKWDGVSIGVAVCLVVLLIGLCWPKKKD